MGLCRQVEIRDILKLGGLRRSLLRLDVPESILHPYSPLTRALVAVLWPLAKTRVLVYEAEGSPAGYLLFQVANRSTGRVLMMASSYGPHQAERRDYAWQCLLEAAAREAGRAGLQQVAAKVPEEGEALALFARCGFRPAGREFLFGAPAAAMVARAEPTPGRPVSRRDRTAFDRLCFELCRTPATAELWAVAFPGRSRPGSQELFVWDSPSGPSVFIAVSGQSRRMLHILYDPAARGMLPGSIAWILTRLGRQRLRTVYAGVRETQQELASILEDMGFKHLVTQSFLVKDVARRIRAEAPAHRAFARSLRPLLNLSRAAQ